MRDKLPFSDLCKFHNINNLKNFISKELFLDKRALLLMHYKLKPRYA